MSIHRAKYLIAAAALAIATLLPGGTTAAAVAVDPCAKTAESTASPSAVPTVLGLSLGAAADRIRDTGHNCKIVNSDFVQVDERVVVVVEQEVRYTRDPDRGYEVVALTRGVVMPDLAGITRAAAEKIAARRAIAVRTSPASAAGDWTVKIQSPAAGAYLMLGEDAGLSLSEPVPSSPGLVPVPDLINSTEDQAAALVKGAGLNYQELILENGKKPGRVISQRPQPGELVEYATTVTADVRRVLTPPPPPPPPTPATAVPTILPAPPVVEFAGGESGRPSWLVALLLGTAVLAVGAVGRLQHRRRPKPLVCPVPHTRSRSW